MRIRATQRDGLIYIALILSAFVLVIFNAGFHDAAQRAGVEFLPGTSFETAAMLGLGR